jgi:hypothetical protein
MISSFCWTASPQLVVIYCAFAKPIQLVSVFLRVQLCNFIFQDLVLAHLALRDHLPIQQVYLCDWTSCPKQECRMQLEINKNKLAFQLRSVTDVFLNDSY